MSDQEVDIRHLPTFAYRWFASYTSTRDTKACHMRRHTRRQLYSFTALQLYSKTSFLVQKCIVEIKYCNTQYLYIMFIGCCINKSNRHGVKNTYKCNCDAQLYYVAYVVVKINKLHNIKLLIDGVYVVHVACPSSPGGGGRRTFWRDNVLTVKFFRSHPTNPQLFVQALIPFFKNVPTVSTMQNTILTHISSSSR